jgi:site-specific DNA-cytosine methylase
LALKRPAWFVGENVTHLDGAPLEQVVSDLEALGYEVAPPFEVPACAFGHDHRRARLWILGHTDRDRQSGLPVDAEVARLPRRGDDAGSMGAAHGVSRRLDARRMAALGNAIVPQIAEWIFRHIQAHESVTA